MSAAAERLLLDGLARGEPCDLAGLHGRERTIPASFLASIVLGEVAGVTLRRRGLRLRRAIIVGDLDLADAEIDRPLALIDCIFRRERPRGGAARTDIDLSGAQMAAVELRGSRFGRLRATRLKVSGGVGLRLCRAVQIVLDEARVEGGSVLVSGARLTGEMESAEESSPYRQLFVAFSAKSCRVAGNLFLGSDTASGMRFHASGEVCLRGAQIGGQLDCAGGRFEHTGGNPLNADNIAVGGSVFLRAGFHASGEVRLLGARIGGQFDCTGGHFDHAGGNALNADNVAVKSSVFLRSGFHASGAVRFPRAQIGGDLDCTGGRFDRPGGEALHADGVAVKGNVFCRQGFHASGEIRLPGAQIDGQLSCTGGRLEHPGGRALTADRLVVGNVFLSEEFYASGEVRLSGAQIHGRLDCTWGRFEHPGGDALVADGITVEGDVFLRARAETSGKVLRVLLKGRFHASGAVRLLGARIDGDLDCTGGHFEQPGGWALSADSVAVKGNVFLRVGFHASGEVRLLGAQIGGQLNCAAGRFEGELSIEDARVGSLRLRELATGGTPSVVSLEGASVGMLVDDASGWPTAGNLHLNRFVFEAIASTSPLRARDRPGRWKRLLSWFIPSRSSPDRAGDRLDWLRRQRPDPEGNGDLHAYQHLAALYERIGRSEDARQIHVARLRLIRGRMSRWSTARWSNFAQGWLLGYGWRIWPYPAGGVVALLLGLWLFASAAQSCALVPRAANAQQTTNCIASVVGSAAPAAPRFDALIYDVERFLPLVDLGQKATWAVDADRTVHLIGLGGRWVPGWVIAWYAAAHALGGWIIVTVLLAWFVVIRRE